MKIIDLLNKIANGEEVPKKIKINGYIYEYRGDDYLFIDKNNDNHEYWLFSEGYTNKFQWLDNFLRTEIETIEEEKKIPEKLNQTLNRNDIGDDYYRYIMENRFTINEIIDYLNSKGE